MRRRRNNEKITNNKDVEPAHMLQWNNIPVTINNERIPTAKATAMEK